MLAVVCVIGLGEPPCSKGFYLAAGREIFSMANLHAVDVFITRLKMKRSLSQKTPPI